MKPRKLLAESWIVPVLASIVFSLLLIHKSQYPIVFNRYSLAYSQFLILTALNLGLFWRNLKINGEHRLLKVFTPKKILPFLVIVFSIIFFADLIAGLKLPRTPVNWINLVLLGGVVIQVETLRNRPFFTSGRFALAVLSLSLTVILLEVLFVVLLLKPRIPKTQSEFLQLMTSNAVRKYNSAWLETPSMHKPDGTIRILGLADSFGIAGGTLNYHSLLEKMLRREATQTIQVINISVPGYTLKNELNLLRYGLAYSPDLILHGFFVGNDFNLSDADTYVFAGLDAWRGQKASPYRPRNFLIKPWLTSGFYLFLEERIKQNELSRGLVNRKGHFSQSTYLKVHVSRLNEWGKPNRENMDRMKKIFSILDSIHMVSQQAGSTYMMVIHPDVTQTDRALLQEIVATFGINEQDYDLDLPQKLLRSYCADREILCLDLLPAFRNKGRTSDLYGLRDSHYNSSGNEVAAMGIAQFLHDHQLLSNGGF